MIYILNNIKFGHPKLYKFQKEYLEIFIMKTMLDSENDNNKIILTGDIFYNNKHTTFSILNDFHKILSDLSFIPIEVIGNDYIIKIFEKYLYQTETPLSIDLSNISLFQFDKEDKSRIGFHIVRDDGTVVFVKNDTTPKFIEYTINTIEDLNEISITKDFIDLTINSDLLENQQNKNIIDLFLNNNTFNNVYYTENLKKEEKIQMDSGNIKIRDILVNNVEDELKDELTEIFTIYDEKLK